MTQEETILFEKIVEKYNKRNNDNEFTTNKTEYTKNKFFVHIYFKDIIYSNMLEEIMKIAKKRHILVTVRKESLGIM